MRYLYAHGILNTSLKTGNHFKIWKQCPKVRGCLLLHGTLPEPVRHSFSARLSIPSHVLHRFSIIAHPDYPISRLSRRHSVKDRLETSWNMVEMCGVFHWAMGVVLGASISLPGHRKKRVSRQLLEVLDLCAGDRTFQSREPQSFPIFPSLKRPPVDCVISDDLWYV